MYQNKDKVFEFINNHLFSVFVTKYAKKDQHCPNLCFKQGKSSEFTKSKKLSPAIVTPI